MFRVRITFKMGAALLLMLCLVLPTAELSISSAMGKSVPSDASAIQADAFNKQVEQMYRHVQDGHMQAVQEDLRRISSLFEASSFEGLTGVEGIHILAECIIEMKEATARASAEPQHWMLAAGKLRLAADSLVHTHDALWLQYFKLIREDLQLMDQHAAKGDARSVKTAYENLKQRHELIRPAMVIQRKPEEVNMLDSWLSYAGGVTASSDLEQVRKIVPQGEELINMLFGKKKDEPALAPLSEAKDPWAWQLVLAAFIVAALTFVGYRKYRGQQYTSKPIFPRKM